MAKEHKLEHGGIVVDIDDDDIDVTSVKVGELPDSEGFRLIKAVANVFFFTAGTDYTQEENLVGKFNKKDEKNKVKMTIPIPADVLQDPEIKKNKDLLQLRYYDKNTKTWKEFDKVKKKANAWTVEMKSWIKDPPVGWGGG